MVLTENLENITFCTDITDGVGLIRRELFLVITCN